MMARRSGTCRCSAKKAKRSAWRSRGLEAQFKWHKFAMGEASRFEWKNRFWFLILNRGSSIGSSRPDSKLRLPAASRSAESNSTKNVESPRLQVLGSHRKASLDTGD